MIMANGVFITACAESQVQMGLVWTARSVGSNSCLKRPYACGNDKCQHTADGKSGPVRF